MIIISYWSGNGVLVVEYECKDCDMKGLQNSAERKVKLGRGRKKIRDDARLMQHNFAIFCVTDFQWVCRG